VFSSAHSKTLRLSLLLGLWLAACARTTPTPTAIASPSLPPTATIVIQITETLTSPTDTPVVAIENSPTPSPEPPCTNDADFLGDLTVPDGAQFLPGQALTKKWGIENSGTCDWGPDYRLVLVEGDALGAPSEAALYPAKGGATVAWEVPIIAPQTPGEYTGRWQARDPEGNLFGDVVFIKIEVIPLPITDTPTP